jgi:SAM-dependent methyltransferase
MADEELAYIAAMSRESVVKAYCNWTDVSAEEALLLSQHVHAGDRVLDLGCGTGRIGSFLREKGCHYVGVDASSEMIVAAKVRYPDLTFVSQNLVDYDYCEGDFDAVLLMHNTIDCLHPYKRRRAFLASCLARLGDGHLMFSSHLADIGPTYVAEDYHGATVHNFRAPHGWHVTELEGIGYQVLVSLECEKDGRYDWAYFVARRRQAARAAPRT